MNLFHQFKNQAFQRKTAALDSSFNQNLSIKNQNNNCCFKLKGYVGCFSDSDPERQLTGLTQSMATSLNAGQLSLVYYVYSTTIMTISFCNYICFSFNFTYTGLNDG